MAQEAKLKQSFQTKNVGDHLVVTYPGYGGVGGCLFPLFGFLLFVIWFVAAIFGANSFGSLLLFLAIGIIGTVLLAFNAGRMISKKRKLTFSPEGFVLRDKLYHYEHVKSLYWESLALIGDPVTVLTIESIAPGDIYFVYGTEKLPLKGRIKSDAGEQLVELLQRELRTRGAPV